MEFEFVPVEKVETVPEQFRGLYSPTDDGKFDVDPKFKPVADALVGFNRTTKQLRQDLKTKTNPIDLSPLAEFGDSPAAIREAINTKIEELTTAGGKDAAKIAAQLESQKNGLLTAHQRELQARDTRATALQNQLYGLMVENAATSAVAELKGVPELLMPFIKQQVKVSEADGQFVVNVLDASGEPRYGATGQLMTIKELVAEMKANEKYGRLFESEAGGGGGTPPGGTRRLPQQQGKPQTSAEKIAAGLAARNRR